MTIIQETINLLRKLDKNASPAPWEVEGAGEGGNTFIEHPMGDVLERDQRGSGHMREDIAWIREADAELIIETRNTLPVLLAEIEQLTTENQNLSGAWEDGYADAICDVEGAYVIDRDEIIKTRNPYQENK